MKKILGLLIMGLLAIPVVPLFAAINVTSTQTTTIAPCVSSLCSSPNPQPIGFNPSKVANYFGQDLGPVTWNTTPSGFSWNVSKSDSMTMKNPVSIGPTAISANSMVFYNSTHTALKLTAATNSLNIYFKPQKYSTKISIQASLTAPESVCIPFSSSSPIIQQKSTVGNPILSPSIKSGSEIFDWSDIKSTYAPSWNALQSALCLSLPAGATNIDPIALDGHSVATGSGASIVVNLTTTLSPDIIIVGVLSSGATVTVSDGAGLVWKQRASQGDGVSIGIWEFYAVANSTLSSDSINATTVGGGNSFSILAYGVSGATTAGSTSTRFDSNAAIPCTATGTGTSASCTISTNNANDFLAEYVRVNNINGNAVTLGNSFNSIDTTANGDKDGYLVVSSTQSGVAITASWTGSQRWIQIIDAIKQGAVTTVTQPIKITTANGAPSATISISGCAVSNATFTANGNVKHYSGITPSCTITLTEPADGANSRYRFNASPHPTLAISITLQTCASGTCSEYDNTTYFELSQQWTVTALSPNTWDGSYNVKFSGTFLGVANHIETNALATTIGATTNTVSSQYDYNLVVNPQQIGNTWILQGNGSFIDTTGGHTHIINYIQLAGLAATPQPTWLWLLFFPGIILGAMIKRRR